MKRWLPACPYFQRHCVFDVEQQAQQTWKWNGEGGRAGGRGRAGGGGSWRGYGEGTVDVLSSKDGKTYWSIVMNECCCGLSMCFCVRERARVHVCEGGGRRGRGSGEWKELALSFRQAFLLIFDEKCFTCLTECITYTLCVVSDSFNICILKKNVWLEFYVYAKLWTF